MHTIKPYSDDELEVMLSDLESDCVERKESFSGDVPRRAREAVCAFANDLPNHNKAGVLFIGAKDNGTPSGIQVTDRLLLTISDIRTDVFPFPAMTVEKRVLRGAEMVVVTVMPSDSPPVKYDGRIQIRTGPRRALASEQEERILSEKRQSKMLPPELRPVPIARLEDLSRVYFEEEYLPAAFAKDVLDANHRSYEERLASCKFIVSPDDTTPTVLGLLVIGKRPDEYIGGAYTQFLYIDGPDEKSSIIDNVELHGRISQIFRLAKDKFTAFNKRSIAVYNQPSPVLGSDYPEVAYEQIVANALMHRSYDGTNAPTRIYWYNNRIEIMSPGGPFGASTIENFGTPGIADYRNRNLSFVCKDLKLCQRFGFGFKWAHDAMAENGNPPLEFKVLNTFVQVTLFKRK
jgi:ATP-dependent DNA helicase RecG